MAPFTPNTSGGSGPDIFGQEVAENIQHQGPRVDDPTLDQLGSGDIFFETDTSRGVRLGQAPSDVQGILAESGLADFERSRDLKKRKKHVAKIKDITGITSIENEDEFIHGPGGADARSDEERLKGVERWMNTSPADKALISQVASGEVSPEQFRATKAQLAVGEEQQLQKALAGLIGDIPGNRGFLTDEQGVRQPTTTEGVRDFVTGERGGIEFQGKKTTVENIVRGGRGKGGGGRGGKGAKEPVSGLVKERDDNAKILKGDTEIPKFSGEVGERLERRDRELSAAINIQNAVGGIKSMSDTKAKAEAVGVLNTINGLENISAVFPESIDLKIPSNMAFVNRFLQSKEIPTSKYNQIIKAIEAGDTFQSVLDRMQRLIGGTL